ncbi:MAG: helix-turn-helix transcriptional regulator [Armatimonadota bacterium]
MTNEGLTQNIVALLAHGTQVLGLRLCYHDHTRQLILPPEWRAHQAAACDFAKLTQAERCYRFEWEEIPRQLTACEGRGRIHRCPSGYTEIAAPVVVDGVYAGTLFAGTCWLAADQVPFADLIIPPDDGWLAARATLAGALALQLAFLLQMDGKREGMERRMAILDFLAQRLDSPVTVGELANHLHLSPSRVAHVVSALFGMPLAALVHMLKLRQAAQLLATTTLPITEIALHCGYAGSSYFTERFRRQYGMSPRAYRQRSPQSV